MRRIMMGVAVVAGVTVVTAACGTGSADDGDGAPTVSVRQLTHDAGTVDVPDVPDVPDRIVTTSDETTELVVSLGLQPVGVASSRVPAAAPDPLDGYYIADDLLGEPEFLGGEEISLEAVVAADPDLIVHGSDDDVLNALGDIAPTAVYDVQTPGAWQEAVLALGGVTDRTDEANAVVDDYDELVTSAREDLAAVAERYPRAGVVYPEYRGGADNYLFDADFALAAAVPDLGFELGASTAAESAFPGVRTISLEAYSTIEADVLLALGTVPWQDTSSAAVLDALDIPVLGVTLDDGQPSAGPLTSPDLVERYAEALASLAE